MADTTANRRGLDIVVALHTRLGALAAPSLAIRGLSMRFSLIVAAAAALTLAACDSATDKAAEQQADAIENQGEAAADRMETQADRVEENAAATPAGQQAADAQANALEQKADAVEQRTDAAADKVEQDAGKRN
jgi:hypothetical protein